MLKPVSYSDTLVVSLEEAGQYRRREDRDDDPVLKTIIQGATRYVENWTGLALVDQTWDYFFDSYPDGLAPNGRFIKLPRSPLLEIEGVFYRYGGELEFSDYFIDYGGYPGRIFLTETGSWPTTDTAQNAGRIRFRAGLLDESSPGDFNEIPADIKMAILLITGTLYEHRETVVIGSTPFMMPWSAEQLLRNHRVETSLA